MKRWFGEEKKSGMVFPNADAFYDDVIKAFKKNTITKNIQNKIARFPVLKYSEARICKTMWFIK